MRKPHVEKYWTEDVYVAPVAMEQTGQLTRQCLSSQKVKRKQ